MFTDITIITMALKKYHPVDILADIYIYNLYTLAISYI